MVTSSPVGTWRFNTANAPFASSGLDRVAGDVDQPGERLVQVHSAVAAVHDLVAPFLTWWRRSCQTLLTEALNSERAPHSCQMYGFSSIRQDPRLASRTTRRPAADRIEPGALQAVVCQERGAAAARGATGAGRDCR